MMPSHYALSDAAIVLVTIWAGTMLWRSDRQLSAFAMACFGVAAAIGVLRFGGGLQAELAPLHAGASQLLGLAGALAIAVTCLARVRGRSDIGLFALILIAAAASYFLAQALLAPIFILTLAIATAATLWRSARSKTSWLMPFGFALLLANALLIRRAPWLGEVVAWHAYHLLIAVALLVLAKAMLITPRNGVRTSV